MENITLNIEVQKYNSTDELEQTDQMLVERSQAAAQRAYAPYSQFKVGACLLLANGKFIEGSNQENASYPCGCCAERSALNYACTEFPGVAITTIAISAYNSNGLINEPITPCGICRQALLEAEVRYNQKIRIIMNGKKYTNLVASVADMLPLSFDNSKL